MSSVPEGRAANHPRSATTLRPPMGASFPGAVVSVFRMGSLASVGAATASGDNASSFLFCVVRSSELGGQLLIVHARVSARVSRDLGRQQIRDKPVLIRGPDRAVPPQECRPRAFLTSETERAVDEPLHEPLEPHRHFDPPSA